MNRRSFLIALGFLPAGGEARSRKRKRKQRKARNWAIVDLASAPLIVADHTPDWEGAIQEALATVNPLLPEWHPQLVYQRREVLSLPPHGRDGEVGMYEVPELVSARGVAEAYYSAWARVPGHRGRISVKASYPAQAWVVIHELMHVLAAVHDHTGWEDLTPPFDASLIRREDIQA